MNFIKVTATPEQLRQGNLYLLGVYKAGEHVLTELSIINRNNVPTSTDLKEFDLIEVDGTVMSLPGIVAKYCPEWDGKRGIDFHFNANGTFANWQYVGTGAATGTAAA